MFSAEEKLFIVERPWISIISIRRYKSVALMISNNIQYQRGITDVIVFTTGKTKKNTHTTAMCWTPVVTVSNINQSTIHNRYAFTCVVV